MQRILTKPIFVVAGIGNGGGTGAASAHAFAKAGYRVALIARNPKSLSDTAKQIQSQGGEASPTLPFTQYSRIQQAAPFPVEAYTRADIQAGFDAIKKHWPDGEIRVALWNAGLFIRKQFLELSEQEVEESIKTNLTGAFAFARQALLAFQNLEVNEKGKRGSLIFTSATAAWRGNDQTSAFASGKSGQRALAQSLNKEFGRKNVHVSNVIVDGIILTDRTASQIPDESKLKDEIVDGLILNQAASQIPDESKLKDADGSTLTDQAASKIPDKSKLNNKDRRLSPESIANSPVSRKPRSLGLDIRARPWRGSVADLPKSANPPLCESRHVRLVRVQLLRILDPDYILSFVICGIPDRGAENAPVASVLQYNLKMATRRPVFVVAGVGNGTAAASLASQMSNDEKVVHLSDAELITLKFLGPAAAKEVIDFIAAIKKIPLQFEWLTVFQLQCLSDNLRYYPNPYVSPTSSTSSDAAHQLHYSETTAAGDDLVSVFERAHFYTGISDDPPPLLHRSDIGQRPFVVPRDRFFAIPEKTAHGVFHPVLKNKFWKETVAPEIIALLKDPSRGVRVSTMLPVRFSTPDENGKDVLDDHVVLWISVHPDTTKETCCRDANAPILAILAKHGIQDVAVHWIEGAVERLAGPPPMMRVVGDTDPTHWVRRALTAVLGVPLAAEELAGKDAQGSLGVYFHEGKNRKDEESTRVMAITNKHVTSKNTTSDYEYSGRPGAAQKFIRNCSGRRFQQVVNETRALIARKLGDAKQFTEQLEDLLAKPASEDEETEDDRLAVERKREDLKRVKVDVGILSDFLKLLNSTWSDAYQRIIGYLDWAPKIANDLDNRCYTRDIGVIALDEDKFVKNFKGNFVYLAGKFTRDEIVSFFYPNTANSPSFEYPKDHLFRLLGCIDAAGLANPYFWDDQGNPCFIVAKDGQTTDLTFGRFSGLEAYTCDEFERNSWEVAIFNFNKKHGNFSGHGDSGAAIFNAEGKLVAFLHSGMPRGMSNHVTFGTPAHYVVEVIKKRYPHADFSRMKFAETAA
ncbi:hypothetical protein CTheo_2924 [Ceratobasidium theobromae]|uniref:Uncharacterized protein n=1 Tax=Ceratobasidium theobromae TaxID=1582974 RepID=A0A5N5QQ11_9AGAM|nr:hypothetical protein CTheo_2924 [Ceratobasidium theobromae]